MRVLERLGHTIELAPLEDIEQCSSLCGACYEVCPLKINIPEVLIHLRHRVVQKSSFFSSERLMMHLAGRVFRNEAIFRIGQKVAHTVASALTSRDTRGQKWIRHLPGVLSGWTKTRDLAIPPKQTFREWFEHRKSSTIAGVKP